MCERILQGLDTELAVEGIGRHGRVDGAQPRDWRSNGPLRIDTFILLLFAVLVMWMAAGFTMLEPGCVSAGNAATICLKNLGSGPV